MLETIFNFVETILGIAGAGPDASGIVAQIFDAILGLLG